MRKRRQRIFVKAGKTTAWAEEELCFGRRMLLLPGAAVEISLGVMPSLGLISTPWQQLSKQDVDGRDHRRAKRRRSSNGYAGHHGSHKPAFGRKS